MPQEQTCSILQLHLTVTALQSGVDLIHDEHGVTCPLGLSGNLQSWGATIKLVGAVRCLVKDRQGKAVSCTVRMFRERFTAHNSTPLAGAWGSSLIQMRGSQCFPEKKGPKKSGSRHIESKALASLQPQQILFKNSTEVLRQQDSNRKGNVHLGRTAARVLCEWMNEGEGWEDGMTAFLQRPQFLQGLTRNKHLYYFPAVKKWSGLFPEYINVSCSESTIHTVSLAGETLSNPARQAMRGEQLDSKERKKVCPACHPQSIRIIAGIGTCESGVLARFS